VADSPAAIEDVRLLGADAAIVGIRPAVAITLVQMGVTMDDVITAINAEQGMARLRRLRADGGLRRPDDDLR
jgi:rsbT antagonist protein RsbS